MFWHAFMTATILLASPRALNGQKNSTSDGFFSTRLVVRTYLANVLTRCCSLPQGELEEEYLKHQQDKFLPSAVVKKEKFSSFHITDLPTILESSLSSAERHYACTRYTYMSMS